MSCIEIDANGNQIPGFNDGINGGVQVPLGTSVKCTAINRTASLKLVKEVINDNGGTAVPSDWTLQATPTGTFPAGLPVISRPGAPEASAQFVNVRPGVRYDLAELGPDGYTNTSLRCTTNNGQQTTATFVILPPLGQTTCVWVERRSGGRADPGQGRGQRHHRWHGGASATGPPQRDRPDHRHRPGQLGGGDATREFRPAATSCLNPVVRPATRHRLGPVGRHPDGQQGDPAEGRHRYLHDHQYGGACHTRRWSRSSTTATPVRPHPHRRGRSPRRGRAQSLEAPATPQLPVPPFPLVSSRCPRTVRTATQPGTGRVKEPVAAPPPR